MVLRPFDAIGSMTLRTTISWSCGKKRRTSPSRPWIHWHLSVTEYRRARDGLGPPADLIWLSWVWSGRVEKFQFQIGSVGLILNCSKILQFYRLLGWAMAIYTVSQKKNWATFIFTVTLANVGRFFKFFQCRNQKEMAHNKNEKFPTVA